MLAVAATKVPDPRAVRATTCESLPVLGSFDLITCIDDALNHLLSEDDVRDALASMARNLAPGGLLVFDVNTLATYRTTFATARTSSTSTTTLRLARPHRTRLRPPAASPSSRSTCSPPPAADPGLAGGRPACTASATTRSLRSSRSRARQASRSSTAAASRPASCFTRRSTSSATGRRCSSPGKGGFDDHSPLARPTQNVWSAAPTDEEDHPTRRSALRQSAQPSAPRAHPRHPRGAHREPGPARRTARREPRRRLVPRAHARAPRADQARPDQPGPRRRRAPLPRQPAPDHLRRGLGRGGPVAKQAFLSSFLQQVSAYTNAAAAAGGFDRADAHFTRTVASSTPRAGPSSPRPASSCSTRSTRSRPIRQADREGPARRRDRRCRARDHALRGRAPRRAGAQTSARAPTAQDF